MQSTNYEFSARGKQGLKRPRLMSNWTLLGFAVVVLIPLVMTFPKQELMRQASRQKLGDILTVNYLSNLLKADPGNLELRILLAEHKMQMEKEEGVADLIEAAIKSKDAEWRAKGLLIEYKLLTNVYLNSEPNSSKQKELMLQRIANFKKLAGLPWPIQTMVYLAGQADELHERNISSLFYRRLSDSSLMMSANWFAGEAANALAQEDYELAAHLYFIARHKEYLLAKQREYLLAGIHALMSGSLFELAMQASDQHLDNLSDDTQTLYALVQSARACGDQARAVRYAKLLLHLTRIDNVVPWFQQFDFGMIGISSAHAASDFPQSTLDGITPYDQKSYELAYDVFIENRKLSDAFRIAEAAVAQVPEVNIWHQRLAQVAEWFGKPEIALREWRWLFHHHGRQDALLAILRLAPSLNDYAALLEVWEHVADKQQLDEMQWNNLADLFEQSGRQLEGIKYFEKRYAEDQIPLMLVLAARLADRSGDDERARTLYFELLKNQGVRSDWLLKIANLYLRKGQYREAYDLLKANFSKVDDKDIPYLKVLADLAWQLQEDNDAKNDYRRLAEAGKLAREDFSRLIYLLDDSKQDEKADFAALAYNRFGDRDMLLQALGIYATRGDLQAQKHLFESVARDHKIDLSGNLRFYLLRAQYFKTIGNFQAARSDFRQAASLAPNDVNTTNAVLWFLIDIHDNATLREISAKIEARGDHEIPAYWGVLASAYQVMGEPFRAVGYYARQLKQGGQDFLWLVNYADALEQIRQTGLATRVRRYAWMQLRNSLSEKQVKLPYSQDMLVAARLALLNFPGDLGLALVSSVLRQDRLLVHDVVADQMTNELVLGWALSKEQSSNAKVWLWRRYSQTLSRPLWADIAIAVAEDDTEHIESLLENQADAMPLLVRHDAANAVDQRHYAQYIAFKGLTDDPENNDIYQRLTEDSLARASYVNIAMNDQQLGTLHRIIQSALIEMPVADHMRVAAEFWNTYQYNDITPDFGSVPQTEKVAGLKLKNESSYGNTEFSIRRRDEFSPTTEYQVIHEKSLSPQINLQFGLEINAVASESTDLLAFGMRDQISAGLLYHFSKREYLQIQPGWARYYTQSGDYLGSGNHVSWELGHLIRIEYPDLTVRLMGVYSGFNDAGNPNLPLPSNANLYGICFGAGQVSRVAYTHAWRPYLDYCSTNNDLSGQGYNAQLGMIGSAVGHDQLSITMSQEVGGANIVNGLSREFKLNYRYFY